MFQSRTYLTQIWLGDDTSPRIQAQLHLWNLLVNLFHKLDYKIDKLVLVHLLSVGVGDEEGDVVALWGTLKEGNDE